jgi:hypothetical protein
VKEQYKMPIVHQNYREDSMKIEHKVSRVMLRVVTCLYDLVYFHFFPYIGLYYSYFIPEHY